MKTNPPISLGLSTLLNFFKRNSVPLTELQRFENQFEETGQFNGNPLWTPRIGRTEEEIRYFNDSLMDWVWHFRDFFWAYATKNLGITPQAAQALTKEVVASSEALRLCGYFTNLRKHVALVHFKDYPKFETAPPKLGGVWVHFVMDNGDSAYCTDLAGAEFHQASSQLPFIQTVAIEDFPGEKDTRRVVEEASWAWIELLRANGVDLGVTKPLWFECKCHIDFFGMGTSPKAIAAKYISLPDWMVGPEIKWEDLARSAVHFVGCFE